MTVFAAPAGTHDGVGRGRPDIRFATRTFERIRGSVRELAVPAPSRLLAFRRIASDPALMLSGPTAASRLRLGLLAGEVVEGYVDARDLDEIVRRHHLRASRDPNVILRVVPTFAEAWPRARHAPLSAVALDLLDDPDPRARTLGNQLLARSGR